MALCHVLGVVLGWLAIYAARESGAGPLVSISIGACVAFLAGFTRLGGLGR